MDDSRAPRRHLEHYRGIPIATQERDGHWQALAVGVGALSSPRTSATDAAREIKQYLDDEAAALPGSPPTPADLRRLAAWYRVFAEKAGNPAVWEGRLHLAEDLEAEAARLENSQKSNSSGDGIRLAGDQWAG